MAKKKSGSLFMHIINIQQQFSYFNNGEDLDVNRVNKYKLDNGNVELCKTCDHVLQFHHPSTPLAFVGHMPFKKPQMDFYARVAVRMSQQRVIPYQIFPKKGRVERLGGDPLCVLYRIHF